ncbi:hypothetical protein BJX99DRAFT_241925 [Aspergillus californicus]
MEFQGNPPCIDIDDDSFNADDSVPTPPAIEYRRTMAELENEVNSFMIETCKVDVCVDLFLSRVHRYKEKNPGSDSYRSHDIHTAYGFLSQERKISVTDELRRNLNRLLPGFLSSQDGDILRDDKLRQKLSERWRTLEIPKDNAEDRNSVPQSLLDTLLEKQHKERTAAVNPSSDDREKSIESCRQLRSFIEGERAAASFSCGGSIPLVVDIGSETGKKASDPLSVSAPVNIFWGKKDNSTAHKLTLPVGLSDTDTNVKTLRRLVADCDPASFGRGEKDVIDPEYRKAGQINVDEFATSFHPADFGILEIVGQVLLPSISDEKDNQLQFRKIKAELYKLNVYSGPSGLFRKHVDTPRADNQIGSLVVCLPSGFTGGSLLVEHHGQKVQFNWSEKSSSSIQWAAFYSDCEHEIETVTQGDRITLTYNLYVTEPVGGVIPSPTSIVDPKTLPMYEWVKDLLAQQAFMKDGGVLGMFCSHAYAHSSKIAKFQLPRALKGADLVLYAVFKSLGIDIEVLPVLETDGRYFTEDSDVGVTGKTNKGRRFYMGQDDDWYYMDNMTKYLHKDNQPLQPGFSEMILPPSSFEEYEDVDRRWKLLMMARKVKGMQGAYEDTKQNKQPVNESSFYKTTGVQVGATRYAYDAHDYGYDAELDEVTRAVWPAYYLPGITWITDPKHEDMAFSQISYGNEASIGTRYSCAAILAVIPPAEKRRGSLA